MEKMKSFKAGTECTLNKPVSCPDNGETLRVEKINPGYSIIPYYKSIIFALKGDKNRALALKKKWANLRSLKYER